MEARPSTPFGVSGKTILTRNTFQKDKRKRRKPPGRMEAGHEKRSRLAMQEKKVLQMARSEDRRRERYESRLCPLVDDEVRSTLHPRTGYANGPIHSVLLSFCLLGEPNVDTLLPPRQPASPARCLGLRSLFHILSQHIQLTGQRRASFRRSSIQSLLGLHGLHNTALGLVGTLDSQA